MRIYVSFVDRDRKLVDELDVHLTPMQRSGKISFWHRGKGTIAGELAQEKARELAAADMVLAIVSPRYNADDDCERELQAALAAGKRPIPILAEAAPLNDTYFDGKVSLPRDNKPLARRPDLDAALVTIVQEIRGMMAPFTVLVPSPSPAPWLSPARSSSPAPSLPKSILEMLPFPWSDPRALSLHEQLVNAYPDAARARALALRAGVSEGAVNFGQAGGLVWHDLIGVAAGSRRLVALVTCVLADPLSSGYWDEIRAAIAPMKLP